MARLSDKVAVITGGAGLIGSNVVNRLVNERYDVFVADNLWRGKGCAECRNTGYRGRTAIFEMIPLSRDLRGLVYDNTNEDEIREAALKNGMTALREAGIKRILDGTTTLEEILRSTVEDL